MGHPFIFVGQDERPYRWAGSRIGCHFDPATSKNISIARNGIVRAVVVYDHFSDGDCHMHFASEGRPDWATRNFIHEAFAFPFLQLKQRRVTALVGSRNHRALALDFKLGFQREGVLRNGLPDDDLIVLGMLAQECRFIQPDYMRRMR